MRFGETLRGLLAEKGITQKQMAADLNIAASTLGNYIQNSREPDHETLKRIADYFDVSVDYLLNHGMQETDAESERELLRIFRSLPADRQELLIEEGKLLLRLYRNRLRDE